MLEFTLELIVVLGSLLWNMDVVGVLSFLLGLLSSTMIEASFLHCVAMMPADDFSDKNIKQKFKKGKKIGEALILYSQTYKISLTCM